jgi:hypothetical protein
VSSLETICRGLRRGRKDIKSAEEIASFRIYGAADAVVDKIDVMMDGGVRRGAHVLKALSLGAKAVGVGRYYLFPLAAAGKAGVEQALNSCAPLGGWALDRRLFGGGHIVWCSGELLERHSR